MTRRPEYVMARYAMLKETGFIYIQTLTIYRLKVRCGSSLISSAYLMPTNLVTPRP